MPTDESMTEALINYGTIVGAPLTIFGVSVVLFLTIQSIDSAQTPSQQSLTRSACLMYLACIAWNLCILLGRVCIPSDFCMIRIPLALCTYISTRVTLYNFFVVRLETAFTSAAHKFSLKFTHALRITILCAYSVLCVFIILTADIYASEENANVCVVTDEAVNQLYAMLLISTLGLLDLTFGIVCVGCFCFKLWRIQRELRAQSKSAAAGSIIADPKSKAHSAGRALMFLLKKQLKLSWISYVSTILIIYVGAVENIFIAFIYVDAWLNVLCVFCAMERNGRCFDWLCDCRMCGKFNGIAKALCCFCCLCCNETAPKMPEVEVLELKAAAAVGDVELGAAATTSAQSQSREVTATKTEERTTTSEVDRRCERDNSYIVKELRKAVGKL